MRRRRVGLVGAVVNGLVGLLTSTAVLPAAHAFTPPPGTTPPPERYAVSGRVAEFPPCAGAMRGVTVVLDPLPMSTQTSLDDGSFSFPAVPPASYYSLRIEPRCNPFGCWPLQRIVVSDGDVNVTLCPTAFTPTPTPTPRAPTPTGSPPGPACVGDCSGDGAVTVNDVIVGVTISLEVAPLTACPLLDVNGDGAVKVNELQLAVLSVLDGCDVSPAPTRTPSPRTLSS